MFDFGFSEILIIAVVALLVLGPDKMPTAVRTISLWVGRMRRSFNNIKRDIEKEIGADEIRRQLRNEEIMARFDSTKNQITKTIDSVKNETESIKDDLNVKKQFDDIVKGPEKSSGKIENEDSTNQKEQSATNPADTAQKSSLKQDVADEHTSSAPQKKDKQSGQSSTESSNQSDKPVE